MRAAAEVTFIATLIVVVMWLVVLAWKTWKGEIG